MCKTKTHQERIVTVTTGDATHTGHRKQRWRHRTRRQVDDALAVGPRAGHPLGRALADEQTVAGAADILFTGRSISNGLKRENKRNHHFG